MIPIGPVTISPVEATHPIRVAELQRRLARAGYLSRRLLTESWGPQTREAIRAYERAQGGCGPDRSPNFLANGNELSRADELTAFRLVDRRISQGAKGRTAGLLILGGPEKSHLRPGGTSNVTTLPYSENHSADLSPVFFSGFVAAAGEGLFAAASLGAVAFSPAFCVAGDGDSFLAASLYESLR